MSLDVRPIHLVGKTILETVRERAQSALETWARDWVRGHRDGTHHLQIAVLPPEARARAHEYEALHTDAGHIWFRASRFDGAQLARAVVGPELMLDSACVDEWISTVVERARLARNRALCQALLGTSVSESSLAYPSPLPSRLFAFGSGAVVVSCEPLGWHAIADGAVWRSVPPGERTGAHNRPALMPLERAVRGGRTRLDVVLGSVEIALPRLLDLRPGDVLRVPERLDQGVAVSCAGKPIARASLGERVGRKCVQILSLYS